MGPTGRGGTLGRTDRLRRPGQRIVVALGIVVGASGMCLGVFAASALVAPAAGAATPCGGARISATIRFGVSLLPLAQAQLTHGAVVTDVMVSGLPSACDGARVRVLLEGNSAGRVAAPTHLLSTATSTLDPCTQSKLSSPPTVETGSITLDLCPTPGTEGGDVSAHELTLVTLSVDTVPVSVTPVTSTASGTGSGAGAGNGPTAVPMATSVGTGLAFTGAEIAALIAAGLTVTVAGIALMILDWRSRRHQATGERTT